MEEEEETQEDYTQANNDLSNALLGDMLNVVECFNELIALTKAPCLSAKNFIILI